MYIVCIRIFPKQVITVGNEQSLGPGVKYTVHKGTFDTEHVKIILGSLGVIVSIFLVTN